MKRKPKQAPKKRIASQQVKVWVTPHRHRHWLEHLQPNMSAGITEAVDAVTNYKEPDHEKRQ